MTKPVRTSFGLFSSTDPETGEFQTHNDIINQAVAKGIIESGFDPIRDDIVVSYVSVTLNDTNEYFDTVVNIRKKLQ